MSTDSDSYTIIVNTYNRHKYLKRLLNFYDQYDDHINILILDSSSKDPDKELNLLFDKKNIEYHRYVPSTFMPEKIAKGCKYIKTPYVLICADDDFAIPQAILKCVNFLNQNTDYSSAQGVTYKHLVSGNDKEINFIFKKSIVNARSIDDDKPIKRLSRYCKDHTLCNTYYSVQRSELFSKIWKESSLYANDWAMAEFFPCSMSLLYGKMKVLPFFYASREANQIRWYNYKRLSEMYSTKNLSKSSTGLANQLCLINKISWEKSLKKITYLLNIYASHALKKKNSDFFLRKLRRGLSKINEIFYKNIKKDNCIIFEDDYNKVKEIVLKYGNLEYLSKKTRLDYSTQGK